MRHYSTSHVRRAPVHPFVPVGLAILSLVGMSIANSQAVEVRVTNEEGAPVVDAMVACVRGGSDAALTGSDGVATVPDGCREVYCERGELVPDRAAVASGKATCVLHAGLTVTVRMSRAQCGKGEYPDPPGERRCIADMRDVSLADPRPALAVGGARRWDSRQLAAAPDSRDLEATLHPLLPGRYHLTIARYPDHWQCGADLESLPAGKRTITPVWRNPVAIKGRVLDRAGKPVADVPLFVRAAGPGGNAPSTWACETTPGENDPTSAEDGTFRLNVDPALPWRIEAGWKNYPIGTAAATVEGPLDRELLLRLQ